MFKSKSMPTLYIVQTSQVRWKIVTEKGLVLQDDITVGRIDDAEDYVKRYVSSFPNWLYEVKPLPKKV